MIIMASKSRAAQEKLQVLEKEAAPFEDQLVEAANFVGTTLDEVRRLSEDECNKEKSSAKAIYHGREEWLLRWLLKKLQAPKNDVPKRTSSSWFLLCYLIRNIPLVNVAQILVERKFTSIVQLALEETDKRDVSSQPPAAGSESSSTERGSPEKKSKKRKRGGAVVSNSTLIEQADLLSLVGAIFAAVNCVVESTSGKLEQGRSSAFVAEYMKTVIRTSAEQSATILGLWLSLCSKALSGDALASSSIQDWLSPFIEIWGCHIAEENQHLQFSLHNANPLLSLIRTLKSGKYPALNWLSRLEALVARNIIVPAKTAYSEDKNTEMLSSLTRISVLQDSANAAIIFEIAIRSVQVLGARKRRRPQDDAWLATVFNTLKAGIPSRASSAKSISAMLRSAIDYKVSIDLEVLREITWEYGLRTGSEDWDLVATILKLDGNTFLIPSEKDLLKELFGRITKSSSQASWIEFSNSVVSHVVVPLMNEFAKARDLSGFIRHWYAQLVATWSLQQSSSTTTFTAWEDEALQTELGKLFESSLTVQQISQILDWLENQIKEYRDSHEEEDATGGCLDAACVILEAIAGSISGDESVVDAVGLRLFHILFDNGASKMLSARYKWRSWRIISRTLTWLEHSDIDELSMLWENGAEPFDILLQIDTRIRSMLGSPLHTYENLEILSYACTAWEAAEAEKAGRLKKLAEPLLAAFLQHITETFTSKMSNMSDGNLDFVNGTYQPVRYMATTDEDWTLWSFARCLFVEHPKVLEFGLSICGNVFHDLLQQIFWIASAGYNTTTDAESIAMTFPGLWAAVLGRDSPVFGNKKLTKRIVDTLLNSTTNSDNPLINTSTSNHFTTHCLHMLRLDDISKSQKEQIMNSWPTPESTALDLPVLALKVKIMRHPAIYDDMKFKDLIELAGTLAVADIAGCQSHLALLKELTRLIFFAALANMDQKRNTTYITEAFKAIQKKVSKASKKKQLNYALISIIGVALVAFREKEMALNDHDIILRDDLESITATFREALLIQLKQHLETEVHQISTEIAMVSLIDALAALGVDASKLASLEDMGDQFEGFEDNELNTRSRLQAFIAIYGREDIEHIDLRGDATTIVGRESIVKRTQGATKGRNNAQKLELLQAVMAGDATLLDELLSTRQIISSIEDVRGHKEDSESFTLSDAYTILAEQLTKVTEIRQFCLISETLELMLKSKGHSMSQYNIDCTVGCITTFCSSQAPALQPIHASTIYTHLCRLLQTILMHHRLKLQGHTHLAQQAMQALLRCLFVPTTPAGTSSVTNTKPKFASRPSWLQPLTTTHAQHFTKLLLLIADPPLSTLSQGRTNPLISLKDKAKRMSAQWTKYIMQEYIWMQLDMNMRMESGIREALMQGWYAVLETMNESGRDAMRGEMDSGGRAVFRGLFDDWRRVGGRREG
ncbi:uncharacterized protein LY89DRAFT_619376 [Mollisia scopiformis]|uniref:Nucleolar 27S pre-rRNA processing Urb2/Npa2 C-terminal domain-containing protein n=1 Tax=Mollisia scopiformis TaxID=149040 RepID=A0A194X5K4_MOLSC|nr:uncharacterized protein LY89DRAFT_619376 [Mollisia scopiformis]KUJ15450.1 hypothetical protein LY89DRAFT_619376 [Mollisia scopiformis]